MTYLSTPLMLAYRPICAYWSRQSRAPKPPPQKSHHYPGCHGCPHD